MLLGSYTQLIIVKRVILICLHLGNSYDYCHELNKNYNAITEYINVDCL